MKPQFDNTAANAAVNSPKISVVIPVYNAEFHLLDAIDSVYAQGLDDDFFEVIVVNDQHSDDLAKQAYHKRVFRELNRRIMAGDFPNLHVIDSAANGQNNGQSAARNAGIRYAKSPYIACLDADDMYAYDPLYLRVSGSILERAVKALDKDEHTSMVRMKKWVFGAGQLYTTAEFSASQRSHLSRILSLNTGNTIIFRRQDALLAGGYPNFKTREDSAFFVRLAASRYDRGLRNRTKVFHHKDYLYRQHVHKEDHVHGQAMTIQELYDMAKSTVEECWPIYERFLEKGKDAAIWDLFQYLHNVYVMEHGTKVEDEPEQEPSRFKKVVDQAKLAALIPYWFLQTHCDAFIKDLYNPKKMAAGAATKLASIFGVAEGTRNKYDLLVDPMRYVVPDAEEMGLDRYDGVRDYYDTLDP